MSFLLEFWRFLRVRKKYWLAPILIVFLLFGGLIVLAGLGITFCNEIRKWVKERYGDGGAQSWWRHWVSC